MFFTFYSTTIVNKLTKEKYAENVNSRSLSKFTTPLLNINKTSKSEVSSAMPSSGGSYVFLERTYGPLVGTISGLG